MLMTHVDEEFQLIDVLSWRVPKIASEEAEHARDGRGSACGCGVAEDKTRRDELTNERRTGCVLPSAT